MSRHGYVPYSHGCRCELCRRGNADYKAGRRREARARARTGIRVDGVQHGSRSAYEEGGCRCRMCLATQASERSLYSRGATA